MRIIQSFWSRPMSVLHPFTGGWPSVKYYWYAWVLSSHQAKATHGTVELVTDQTGASILVDQLNLPFDKVDVVLDQADAHPGLWKFGKILAYAYQQEPFLHIESDVFLWKRLPEELLAAPLLVQHIELPAHPDFAKRITQSLHRLKTVMPVTPPSWSNQALKRPAPEEANQAPASWQANLLYELTHRNVVGRALTGPAGALCCGVFGGHDLEAIHQITREVREAAEAPGNRKAWLKLGRDHPVGRETYPNALLEHYTAYRVALERRIHVWTVFPPGTTPMDDPYLQNIRAEAFGFTHVMDEKANAQQSGLAARLEDRVRRDYPESYERVQRLLQQQAQPTKTGQAANMLRATAQAARSIARTKIARKQVSKELYQQRIDVCRHCPGGHVKMKRGEVHSCGPMLASIKGKKPSCGCFLKSKARDAKQDCPLGYWPKATPPLPEADVQEGPLHDTQFSPKGRDE